MTSSCVQISVINRIRCLEVLKIYIRREEVLVFRPLYSS